MKKYDITRDCSKFNLKILDGCEGKGIYVNDYRVSGPKPWGGAKASLDVYIPIRDLVMSMGISRMNEMSELPTT